MKGNQFYLWLYILYWIVSSIAIYYYVGLPSPASPTVRYHSLMIL